MEQRCSLTVSDETDTIAVIADVLAGRSDVDAIEAQTIHIARVGCR